MNILLLLTHIISHTLIKCGIFNINSIKIWPTDNDIFGHYQINGLINLSKHTNKTPREIFLIIQTDFLLNIITQKLVLEKNLIVNITLNHIWIIKLTKFCLLKYNCVDKHKKHTIILDYSSPNLAKELHVGNLRSTILGDAMAKIYSYLGYNIIKVNHVGDWGTPIGMIIAYIIYNKIKYTKYVTLKEINLFYKNAQILYKTDNSFISLTKTCLLKLQKKDSKIITLWQKIRKLSLKTNQKIYNDYRIDLHNKNVCGESFYLNYLNEIIKDLLTKGLAIQSQGAIITNLEDGSINNLIIKKTDGSYLYATTDIAALKYRCDNYNPDKIIYFIDIRQRQYLAHIWAISKKAGYVPYKTLLEHHFFGMILNNQGKPFKSREGKSLSLEELLNEAINKTEQLLLKKDKLNINVGKSLIKKITIGSIKYYDLSRNRESNYIFNWKNILTLEGNTALYIQYAYCRIKSILNKVNIDKVNLLELKIKYLSNHELLLIFNILRFEEVLETIIITGYPNLLCNYLYKLTKQFNFFYEHFNVLQEKNIACLNQRIKLLFLVENIIKRSMGLLGIELSKSL